MKALAPGVDAAANIMTAQIRLEETWKRILLYIMAIEEQESV